MITNFFKPDTQAPTATTAAQPQPEVAADAAAAADTPSAGGSPAAGETSEAAATTDAPAADESGPSEPAPAANAAAATKKPDPHNLRRFVSKAREYHAQALGELQAGHKASCWSWYVLPTPPFIKNGREVGSGINRT